MKNPARMFSLAAGVAALFCHTVLSAAETAPVGKPLQDGAMLGSLVQMILGLVVVLAIILAGAWMVRRLGKFQGVDQQDLRVLGALSMGARERIVLVQAGEQQLLVGVTPGQIRTLHVLEHPIAARQGEAATGTFAERLAGALASRKR